MALVGKPKVKRKKHGVKAGQKSLVRPSQKKSVKNGRALPKPKAKNTKKVVEKPVPEIQDTTEYDDTSYVPDAEEYDDLEDELDEESEALELSDGQ